MKDLIPNATLHSIDPDIPIGYKFRILEHAGDTQKAKITDQVMTKHIMLNMPMQMMII